MLKLSHRDTRHSILHLSQEQSEPVEPLHIPRVQARPLLDLLYIQVDQSEGITVARLEQLQGLAVPLITKMEAAPHQLIRFPLGVLRNRNGG